jgi:hypothetical protein
MLSVFTPPLMAGQQMQPTFMQGIEIADDLNNKDNIYLPSLSIRMRLKAPYTRGLPGNELSFLIVPLSPAYPEMGGTGHLPVSPFRRSASLPPASGWGKGKLFDINTFLTGKLRPSGEELHFSL